MFLETSRRFDLSSRSLGHIMFSFHGNCLGKQELVVDQGQLVSLFTFIDGALFFMYISFTFLLVIVALLLALWCCQVKQSVRWHCSGHQHRLYGQVGVFLEAFQVGRLVSAS